MSPTSALIAVLQKGTDLDTGDKRRKLWALLFEGDNTRDFKQIEEQGGLTPSDLKPSKADFDAYVSEGEMILNGELSSTPRDKVSVNLQDFSML